MGNHVVSGSAKAASLKTDTQLDSLDKEKLNVTITDGKVMISDAMVIKADIMASNGVVHEVDGVLLPSDFMATDCGTGTLSELVTSVPTLSTLLAALGAADLVATFSDKAGGPYTVFAPTDTAFGAVQTVVDCLLKPENKGDLTSVLLYHVLPTYVLASDIKNKATAVTMDDKLPSFSRSPPLAKLLTSTLPKYPEQTTLQTMVLHISSTPCCCQLIWSIAPSLPSWRSEALKSFFLALCPSSVRVFVQFSVPVSSLF